MNCTIKKTTTAVSTTLKKLRTHVSSIPFANSLKCFPKPKEFLACGRLFSSQRSDFFCEAILVSKFGPYCYCGDNMQNKDLLQIIGSKASNKREVKTISE